MERSLDKLEMTIKDYVRRLFGIEGGVFGLAVEYGALLGHVGEVTMTHNLRVGV